MENSIVNVNNLFVFILRAVYEYSYLSKPKIFFLLIAALERKRKKNEQIKVYEWKRKSE